MLLVPEVQWAGSWAGSRAGIITSTHRTIFSLGSSRLGENVMILINLTKTSIASPIPYKETFVVIHK